MGLIGDRVAAARQGENATVIGRMRSGWAVLSDQQHLRGWCVLLPDPVPDTLNAMPLNARGQFLTDMAGLGDAILAATNAVRINYSIYGNQAPQLHAHVVPRYADEPEEMRPKPHWLYPTERTNAVSFDLQRDAELMRNIARDLRAANLLME